jgi:hypothetical protein
VHSLGRALLLSQDPALAARAHELLVKAKEAICSGQQLIRRTLRRIGATP